MTARTIALLGVLLGLGLTPATTSGQDKPPPLVFCAEPAAMPRTGKGADGSPQGLDIVVAKLVCRKLGRSFEVHWCSSPQCSRNCLREKRCDVILGHPLDEGAPRDVAWSVPYAGAQFGLVVPAADRAVRSLADLVGKRVGIVAGTVVLPEDKQTIVRFQTRDEVLDRFAHEQLDAAFMDADFAAWHVQRHPKLGLRLVPEFVPQQRWNVAFAVRAESAPLLVQINQALSELAEAGELKKAFAELGVPHRPPFTGSARRPTPVDTWKRIQERGEIVVAMDPANLPYSSAREDRPGFDVELAREVAQLLGLKLRIEWLDVQRETAIGKLLENECDLAFGAAVDPNAVEDDEELAGKVAYSVPYYGTGYVLVTRQNGPQAKSLAELKGEKSRRIGTEAGSVADYHLRQRGYQRSLFRNQLAVLKALDDGTIDYGYLWANVGWTLHTTPEFKLQVVPGYVPEDRWNIAVALRRHDLELKRRLDQAIEKLVDDGRVARVLARYHVPCFPPFDLDRRPQGSAGIIRHPVADRGPEPQLGRVQTSKNPYAGLERVRSAGALVVGLDQNNLPFSTAHPEPAGLDYDIARLLADRLGVSLRVYWAYSQHDSYPSKLATRKLCDVILGVMRDDRFADRVLYTKPYYMASYQLAVPAGAGAAGLDQLGDAPVVVEPGVAVRGLQGRTTQTLPDLEAILESVAAGRVPAGYVISTRGSWLAHQRWPGKIRFVAGHPADRFAICAAVRKSDADLKAALDQALDDLARSGQLAEVFDRWKVPYAAVKE